MPDGPSSDDDVISIDLEDLGPEGPSASGPSPVQAGPSPSPSSYGQGGGSQPGQGAKAPGTHWYVARTSVGDRTVYGPYDGPSLREMLRAGRVAWQDQVSRGGSDPWRPAAQVPELGPAPGASAPTPQAPLPPPTGYPGASPFGPMAPTSGQRNYVVAGIFALLLGAWGVHKFYNGSWGWGLVYLLMFWAVLPGIVAMIEGIMYLVDEQKYNRTYNETPPSPWKW